MLTREPIVDILLRVSFLSIPIFIAIWIIASMFFWANILFGNLQAGNTDDAASLKIFKDRQIMTWSRCIKKTFWYGFALNLWLAWAVLAFVFIQHTALRALLTFMPFALAWIVGFRYMSWSLKKLQDNYSKKYMSHSVLSLYVAHWSLLAGAALCIDGVILYVLSRMSG